MFDTIPQKISFLAFALFYNVKNMCSNEQEIKIYLNKIIDNLQYIMHFTQNDIEENLKELNSLNNNIVFNDNFEKIRSLLFLNGTTGLFKVKLNSSDYNDYYKNKDNYINDLPFLN